MTAALPPLLVCEVVERFLDEHGIGSGPIDAAEIGEGHSNVTYRIRREGACVVLRRPPRPPLPPSAHDVLREARVLRGLEGSGVPVPRVLASCDDESLLGVPFYVMEFLDGVPMTSATPPGLRDPAHHGAMAQQMISALATLHGLDAEAHGLGDLGRPDGYLERQVRRFAGLWERGRTRALPELDEVTEWSSSSRATGASCRAPSRTRGSRRWARGSPGSWPARAPRPGSRRRCAGTRRPCRRASAGSRRGAPAR